MKFTLTVLTAILATASAASIDTCLHQKECVSFSIEKVTNGATCDGPCYFKICMEITNNDNACDKFNGVGEDTISHSCVKPTDQCFTGGGFAGDLYEETADLQLGHTQCQMVAAGGQAIFLLKDGNADEEYGCGLDTIDYFDLHGSWTATCQGREVAGLDSCTGNAAYKECIWSVPAPECEAEFTPIETEPPQTTVEAPTDPAPTDPAPTDPAPTDPAPTDPAPTDPAPTDPAPTNPPNQPSGGGGDPHFARWGQAHDSFHGECDLVMVHSDNFHNGAGFDLHARTTIQDYFSYMETAALRVGDNVLEFYNDHFYMNGERFTPEDLPMTFGGEFQYTIKNGQIEFGKNEQYYQYYAVDLHEDSTMLFKFYKKFLTIDISGNVKDFKDSVGLLGDFHTGAMITRDGAVMTDFVQFGFEWQVNPDDQYLFRKVRAPQLPYEQCRMPTAARPARRHLRGDAALFQQAFEACAHVTGSDFDLCADDVMATGDVGLASMW